MTDTLKPSGVQVTESEQLGSTGKVLLGSGLLFLFLILIYIMAVLWPSDLSSNTTGDAPAPFRLFRTDALKFNVSMDVRLVLLVAVAGALGSCLWAASAFVTYLGKDLFDRRWLWWYILRPVMGAALATIFYFAIRGGLFASGSNTGAVNAFSIAALSALVGLFSKQATDKLDEVFQALFKTGTQPPRSQARGNPVPKIDSVDRSADPTLLEVTGSNFVAASKVQVHGADRNTQYKDESNLQATLDATDSGDVKVTVINPPPGGGTSNEVTYKL